MLVQRQLKYLKSTNVIPVCPDSLRVFSFFPEEGFPWDVPRSEDKFHCASILSFFPSLEVVTEIWVEWKITNTITNYNYNYKLQTQNLLSA